MSIAGSSSQRGLRTAAQENAEVAIVAVGPLQVLACSSSAEAEGTAVTAVYAYALRAVHTRIFLPASDRVMRRGTSGDEQHSPRPRALLLTSVGSHPGEEGVSGSVQRSLEEVLASRKNVWGGEAAPSRSRARPAAGPAAPPPGRAQRSRAPRRRAPASHMVVANATIVCIDAHARSSAESGGQCSLVPRAERDHAAAYVLAVQRL